MKVRIALTKNIKSYQCDSGSYMAFKASVLESHQKLVHGKMKDNHCDQCEYKSPSYGNLRHHKQQAHDAVKDQHSGQCEYKCSVKENLAQHKKHSGKFKAMRYVLNKMSLGNQFSTGYVFRVVYFKNVCYSLCL